MCAAMLAFALVISFSSLIFGFAGSVGMSFAGVSSVGGVFSAVYFPAGPFPP